MLVIGITTLTLCSCESPTVSGTVDSCVTSQKFQVSKCGKRIVDYKQTREKVGEWEDINKLQITPISDMGDQVCFSLDNWLTKVKPKLKEGHDFWQDNGNSKSSKPITKVLDNETIKSEEL